MQAPHGVPPILQSRRPSRRHRQLPALAGGRAVRPPASAWAGPHRGEGRHRRADRAVLVRVQRRTLPDGRLARRCRAAGGRRAAPASGARLVWGRGTGRTRCGPPGPLPGVRPVLARGGGGPRAACPHLSPWKALRPPGRTVASSSRCWISSPPAAASTLPAAQPSVVIELCDPRNKISQQWIDLSVGQVSCIRPGHRWHAPCRYPCASAVYQVAPSGRKRHSRSVLFWSRSR